METRLYVGQRINQHGDEWEILELIDGEHPKARVRVHACSMFQRYLDPGSEYVAWRHSLFGSKPTEVWEIPPDQMKRSVSQVLMFYFHDDEHPCFELDM